MQEKYEGLIIYTIEADGCLNGIYTNTNSKETGIYNECDRKILGSACGIDGKYQCTYIQYSPKVRGQQDMCNGTLTIAKTKDKNRYELSWEIIYNNNDEEYAKTKVCFKGIGLMRDEKYLAVSYQGL